MARATENVAHERYTKESAAPLPLETHTPYTACSMTSSGFSVRSLGGPENLRPKPRPNRSSATRGFFAWIGRMLAFLFALLLTGARWLRATQQRLGWKKFLWKSFGVFVGLCVLYILFLWITLPSIADPRNLRADQSTVITDRNGTELYRVFGDQDRTIIPSKDIPDTMKKAIIAIEDQRFYTRGCLDIRALARAVFSFGHSGGASTLTRQLARNALNLQRENAYSRKLKELILGCQLEAKYSKDQLLEFYLNWIPFGQNAYGVEQASKNFFGISASGLTLAQSAVLASLPQSPTYYSPYGRHVHTTVSSSVLAKIKAGTIKTSADIPDNDATIGLLGTMAGTGKTLVYVGGRSDQVLFNMQAQGMITEEQRLKAIEDLKKITFKKDRENIRAPHFVLWIRDQVAKMFSDAGSKGLLEQGGLTIETTLDWKVQQEAEKAVAARKDSTLKLYMAHNISLLALDPATREVLAYVGNTDYADEVSDGKVDMVQAPRQPGSSFKPFVYSAAFLQGANPATIFYDVKTKFGDDEPQNFEGNFWGLINARRALAGSRNIPAIKAFFYGGGEDAVLDLAAKLGVVTPRTHRDEMRKAQPDYGYGWPLAIGAAETPLLEMVNGYSTLADAGIAHPVISIKKITTSKGVILYQAQDKPEDSVQVIDPRVAYQVTSILSDVDARPTPFWQQSLTVPGYEAAAKTGTSNKCIEKQAEGVKGSVCKDRRPESLWTIGYTPSLVAGVWVGNADSTALSPTADGLNVAAPIWKQFMTNAMKVMKDTKTNFPVPSGIVTPQISLLSGELATECTPVQARAGDVFLQEKPPSSDDPACVKLLVDKVTGLLASDACPVDAQEEQSFLVPKSILADRWPLWEQGVQSWATNMRKTGSGVVFGTGSGAYVLHIAPTEKCDPSLTPGRLIKPTVDFLSPSNGGTASYPSFRPKISVSSGSPIQEIVYTLDDTVIATEHDIASRIPLRIPKSISSGGSHELKVTITDQYFNKAEASVHISFGADTGAPEVRIAAPEANATFKKSDTVKVAAEATDNEGEVKYVEFFIDDTLLARRARAPYALEYPLKDITSGTHTLRAVATDLSDKTGEDAVTITVE